MTADPTAVEYSKSETFWVAGAEMVRKI